MGTQDSLGVEIFTPMTEQWLEGRPIFSRLPEKGYKDNDIVDALTAWVDSKLTDKATQLQEFYKELDPVTASEEKLDYLAWLVGLSGNYWDTTWSAEVKRSLIAASHQYLWTNRGTLEVIEFILRTHGIAYDTWLDGSSTLPFKMPRAFGANKLRFFVRLPLAYARTSQEWKEAERTLRNFAPAVVKNRVCYQGFKMGFSTVGDPMFRTKDRSLGINHPLQPDIYARDDFDGTGSLSGRVTPVGGKQWYQQGSQGFSLDGAGNAWAPSTTYPSSFIDVGRSDVELEIKISDISGVNLLLMFNVSSDFYTYTSVFLKPTSIELQRKVANNYVRLANGVPNPLNKSDVVRIRLTGDTFQVFINGVRKLVYQEDNRIGKTETRVGLRKDSSTAQNSFKVDYFEVRELLTV